MSIFIQVVVFVQRMHRKTDKGTPHKEANAGGLFGREINLGLSLHDLFIVRIGYKPSLDDHCLVPLAARQAHVEEHVDVLGAVPSKLRNQSSEVYSWLGIRVVAAKRQATCAISVDSRSL